MTAREDEILIERKHAWSIVQLNRPRALNALTTGMLNKLQEVYMQAEATADSAVLLKGAGGRALCAGGDVRRVVQGMQDGSPPLSDSGNLSPGQQAACQFFTTEYDVDYLLSETTVPQVAIMDGIIMGGGVGLATHGLIRIATKNTVWAMPEVKIGLFPDVGASWFLSRLPGEVGLYLGLTGRSINGRDAKFLGLATHIVKSSDVRALEEALLSGRGKDHVMRCCSRAEEGSATAVQVAGTLPPLEEINEVFEGDSVGRMIDRLHAKADSCDWAAEALDMILAASPLAVYVTLRLLREGSAIGSLRDCLRLEWRLACQCLLNGESDFPEGVAAALIRKDRAPAWRYRWPEGTRNSGLAAWQAAGCEEAVPSAAVDAMFAPLRADVPRPQYLFAEEARPRL